MSHPPVRIDLPDGQVRERALPVGPDAPSPAPDTLAAWLEAGQIPLNTRCGGRGLCRGCRVSIDGNPPARACQIGLPALLEHPPRSIRIPEASLRDHTINGVSAFEVDGPVPDPRLRPGIGLALDIGTTTVAAALWDLASGKCLADGSVANEQRRFGDNVLARIDHAVSLGGASPDLQRALVLESLLPLVEQLCHQSAIPPDAITEGYAAGNTVMQHGLAGASLKGFSSFPFRPEFVDTRRLSAAALGFPFDFPIDLAPSLGAFVGGDIAVGALAAGMLEDPGPALLIDFGTNGEILLKTGDRFLATATAAGPAFEGGRLSCGSPAGRQVISALYREDGAWRYRLSHPGSGRPSGISGAAYVDGIALAREAGILNPMGRLDPDHPQTRTVSGERGDSEKRLYLTRSLFISESDVAELIQAKAAIAAGVLTLLEEAGLAAADLRTAYIAGGFGYHLNLRHAMAVGLMPELPPDRCRVIGNASLGGASLILQAGQADRLQTLRCACTVVELNQLEAFEDHFIDCMRVGPAG